MQVTVDIITDNEPVWGDAITCDDYVITTRDGFNQIRLTRTIDGVSCTVLDVIVSPRHSFRLKVAI